jgi:hypothetical protein
MLEGWKPERDIQAFPSILFEIIFGHPPQGEVSIHTGVPDVVSMMIKLGLSPISGKHESFSPILKLLKWNGFQIEDRVDSMEVSAFVSWVESAEHSDH